MNFSADELAKMLDTTSDDGDWSGADVCDAVSDMAAPAQVRCEACGYGQWRGRDTCIHCYVQLPTTWVPAVGVRDLTIALRVVGKGELTRTALTALHAFHADLEALLVGLGTQLPYSVSIELALTETSTSSSPTIF
jgi:hypothetical protein